MATAVAPRMFKNFINGEWVESRSGKAYENRNPANTEPACSGTAIRVSCLCSRGRLILAKANPTQE